jgi:preprotein translocase subunit SecF
MAATIVCGLTIINNFILFNDVKDEDRKPTNREVMVNEKVGSKFKTLIIINGILLIVTAIMFFTLEINIINLVRPLLLGIIIAFYSAVFMVIPFWGHFVKERKVRKVEKIEEDYVK